MTQTTLIIIGIVIIVLLLTRRTLEQVDGIFGGREQYLQVIKEVQQVLYL